MTKICELMDAAKLAHNLPSDYALAKTLGITRFQISAIRKGTQQPDNFALAKLAEALKLDPLEVIAQVETENAKTEERRAFWRDLPGGLKRTLLGGLAWCLIGNTSAPAPSADTSSSSHNVYYVKL